MGINECKSDKHHWKLTITNTAECEEKNWKKMVNEHAAPLLYMYWIKDTEPFEKEGDTIELHLDMDDKTLSYTINGKNYGVAVRYIDQGNYRLAVSVCVNQTITLIQ